MLHSPVVPHVLRPLTAGFLAQTGRSTVSGMLTGAGLSRAWRHDRAHRFFSAASWETGKVAALLARLIVSLLVPEGEPVLIAVDDTLFRRTGKKVHAIGWFHDGSAKGPRQVGLGNNWVIAAVVGPAVRIPPGGTAGRRPPGAQGHYPGARIPAGAGPADDLRPGRRPARP